MATKIERLAEKLKQARKDARAATKAYETAVTGKRPLKAEMKAAVEHVEALAGQLKDAKTKARSAPKDKVENKVKEKPRGNELTDTQRTALQKIMADVLGVAQKKVKLDVKISSGKHCKIKATV